MGILAKSVFLWHGYRNFTKPGFEKHAKMFDAGALDKDLTNVVVAITGANQGLGLQTAMDLAQRKADVIMVCRNPSKGAEAVEKVKQASGNPNVSLMVCDVSSLESIRSFVAAYKESGKSCHVLVNNAGAMVNKVSTSAEGHEMNFATNSLGTWALTRLMDPVLRQSAPSRIITITSGGMYTENLTTDFKNDDLKGTGEKFDGTTAYARDKRRQLAFSEWLAKHYSEDGVKVAPVLMHPGWSATGGLEDAMPGLYKAVEKRLRSVEEGCDTTVWLAMQPYEKLLPGEVYFDRKVTFKHFWGMGTEYEWAKVEEVVRKLDQLAGISGPQS